MARGEDKRRPEEARSENPTLEALEQRMEEHTRNSKEERKTPRKSFEEVLAEHEQKMIAAAKVDTSTWFRSQTRPKHLIEHEKEVKGKILCTCGQVCEDMKAWSFHATTTEN